MPPDQYFRMCVADEERCGDCDFCSLVAGFSAPARLPCSGPDCQDDACCGAPGGLCVECGQTACAKAGGCPFDGIAPREMSCCWLCAMSAETPLQRERRQQSVAASCNPRAARLLKMASKHRLVLGTQRMTN